MAKRYKVLVGIQNDKLKRRHEPGEVVELIEPEWDVKNLLAIRAVEDAEAKDPAPHLAKGGAGGGTDATQLGVVFTDAQKQVIKSLTEPGD